VAEKKPARPAETKWLVRSISLPVQECLSRPWPDFLRLLHGAWRQSTDLANWASQTLARSDVVRTPALAELPPFAAVDLYALAFGRAREKCGRDGVKVLPVVAGQVGGWAGARVAAASLLRRVRRKYLAERGKIVWRRERRTPEYLYPMPFPVHQQAWAASLGDRNAPLVSLALPGGRVTVRLRQGPEFAAALGVFRSVAAGDVAQQELSLCRQRSSAHARTDSERRPGGGHRESYRVMARIAYRVEVPDGPAGGVLFAATGADPFLTLTLPGAESWVLHAPWVRRWVAEHRRFLAAFADDLKYEKRWPAGKRKRLNRYRERRCEKHARRMKSFLQQTAAQAVGWAVRRRAGRVVLDTADRSFAESFPWSGLVAALQAKCDEFGVVLVADAGGGEVESAGDDAPAAGGVAAGS
jgi:hypothetical protein